MERFFITYHQRDSRLVVIWSLFAYHKISTLEKSKNDLWPTCSVLVSRVALDPSLDSSDVENFLKGDVRKEVMTERD